MKKKIAQIAFYALVSIIAFFIGMKCYREIYSKGFRDGVDFTLNEIKTLNQQNSYGDGIIRGI